MKNYGDHYDEHLVHMYMYTYIIRIIEMCAMAHTQLLNYYVAVSKRDILMKCFCYNARDLFR